MRRFLLVSLLLLALAAVLGAGIGWYLLHDEDFLKARLHAFVQEQTGRDLRIEGPLTVALGRQTTVEARGIRYRNAPWAEPGDMVSLGHLRVTVDVPSLFGETPVIPSLLLEDCDIRLQQNEAGDANWDVLPESPEAPDKAPAPPTGPPVLLLDAQIHRCSVRLDTPERSRPLTVEADGLELRLVDEIRWRGSGSGRVNDETFRFSGGLEPAGALLRADPVQWDLDLSVGAIALRSSGSVEDPKTGRGADMEFLFSGPEMATILEHFELPALSEGAFDFRLELASENHATNVAVDGDLGSLMLDATGTVDRLVWPQSGALQMTGSGPDLRALGEALNMEGLVPGPYEVAADLSFDGGVTRARSVVVQTPHDRVELTGVLGRAPAFAESNLTIAATTGDIGRWRPRIGLPEATVGPAALDGAVVSDAVGLFSVRGKLDYASSVLGIEGTLGTLGETFEPELDFSFESPNAGALAARFGVDGAPPVPTSARGRFSVAASMMRLGSVKAAVGEHRAEVDGVVNPVSPFVGTDVSFSLDSPDAAALGRLFGRDGLPPAPLKARGRVSRPDQRLRFDGLNLDLGRHRSVIEGYLNPASGFAGSDLEVGVDSPDVAELASLFGVTGIPGEAMKLTVSLAQEDEGLRFRTSDVSVGEIKLEIDGRIADLAEPLGIDANFDIRLPTLKFLGFLAPEQALPDLPLTAHGRLNNEQDHTRLEDVRLTLGTFAAEIAGDLFTDQRFALTVDVSGPDASDLEPWVGRALQPQPFSLHTNLEGGPSEFSLNGLDARLGRSDARGALQITLGERKRISGRLESDYFDLGQFRAAGEDEEAKADGQPPRYVFEETPIVSVDDPGVDLDLGLAIAVLDLGQSEFLDLEFGVGLAGRRLELSPFSMHGGGGGALSGRATLDARGAVTALSLEFDAQRIRLGLAAAEDQTLDSYPPTDFNVSLSGEGVTWRELASRLNGRVRIYSGEGQIAASGLDLFYGDFLTGLFTTLNPFAAERKYTTLECSVIAATILDGQVSVYPVVYQTKELTILSQGAIDLHTEKIDLSFNTRPRQGIGLSAGVLINPLIKVGGRLAEPAIELDPAGAAVSGGLAVATAGISLLAKSAYDRFLTSKDPCGDARREIDKIDRGE